MRYPASLVPVLASAFVILGAGLSACGRGQPVVMADFITLPRAAYAELDRVDRVDFVAVDLQTGRKLILEGSDIYERHAPWSTFKIPNTLIGLARPDCLQPDEVRDWDAERWPAASFWPDSWRDAHDLGSAFRNSVVWYYRELAQCVGGEAYQETLGRWGYGNAQLDPSDDAFWLGADLQISPWEQARFLENLHAGTLGVAPADFEQLENISADAAFPEVHGKTGAGSLSDGSWEGWYVGYVERQDQLPVVFALYAHAGDYADIRSFRREFSLRMLQDAGYLSD